MVSIRFIEVTFKFKVGSYSDIGGSDPNNVPVLNWLSDDSGRGILML